MNKYWITVHFDPRVFKITAHTKDRAEKMAEKLVQEINHDIRSNLKSPVKLAYLDYENIERVIK